VPDALPPRDLAPAAALRDAQARAVIPPRARLRPTRAALALGAAAVLAGWPLAVTRDFYVHVAILILINVIGALSLNLLMRAGLLSFAHSAFMAIGAYTSVLLMMRASLPFPLAFAAAGLVPGLIALALGPVLLRLKGVYFVLVTFALGEIVRLVFVNWISLFGGSNGIYGIPPAAVPVPGGTLAVTSKFAAYLFAAVVTVVAVALVARICSSEMGRALHTIAEDELLAESLGIATVRYKVVAFVVGAVLVGFGGSLYAHYIRYISPGDFTWRISLDFIVINVVGGMHSIAGPVLAAAFIVALPEFLRHAVQYQWILYSVILILVLAFLPEGLADLPRRFRAGRRRIVG
jgi:branched-chain amino acid transport system permease protein